MRGGVPAPPDGATRRRRRWAAVPLAAIAAVAVLLVAAEAGAQTSAQLRSEINDLRGQIGGLRKQLAELERVVYGGEAPRSQTSPAEPADDTAERNSRRLAELETDIDRSREWQRQVTGRFEEIDNRLHRIEGRIERLVADVDFRLSALEDGLSAAPAAAKPAAATPAAATPAAAKPAAAAPVKAPAGTDEAGIAPEQDGGYEPSGEPRSLGTIPAEQADDALLPAPAQTPEEQYRHAFSLLESAQYEEAHEAFSRFIDANPAHDLAENAAYWRAETQYARQSYGDAVRAYAYNLQQFPNGRKAPDNMVKLGMALLRLGRSEEACRTFAQLDRTFPDLALNIRRAAQQGRRQADCP